MANVLTNDIYDLVESVQDLEQRYIPEEAPETLALGIYGYLAIIAISEILNFTISLIQLYKVTKFKFDYFSYIVVPTLLVLATKFLFDAIDNYIEYDTGFVIFKVLIFISIYIVLLISFNIFKFIKQKRVVIIK